MIPPYKAAACVVAALLLATAAPAKAVVLLDQEYVPDLTLPPSGHSAVGQFSPTSLLVAGQTFTTGLTGVLSSIEIFLTRSRTTVEDLTLDIRTPNGVFPGLPGATLASASRTASSIALGSAVSVSFDLSAANLAVSAGDFLSFVLSSPTDHVTEGSYNVRQSGAEGGYAGGTGYTAQLGNGTNFSPSLNLLFRSFVDVEVSEPGAIIPLIAGLAVIGLARRRR